MTKTMVPCSTDTLMGIVRRDISHAVEMLEQAGLPPEIAAQLAVKIREIVYGTMDTYGPGSIGAEVKALAESSDEKVSQP